MPRCNRNAEVLSRHLQLSLCHSKKIDSSTSGGSPIDLASTIWGHTRARVIGVDAAGACANESARAHASVLISPGLPLIRGS